MAKKVMINTKTPRFMELEGLRGVAAVMVALYHFLITFYAFAFFGDGTSMATVPNNHFESVIHGNPIMAFVSGSFAVSIFFVLSGFVLSIGYFQTGRESIIKKLAAKRYIRLMLPALASILVCYLLIKLGLSNTYVASTITHSGWLSVQWTFTPQIEDAFINGIWGIFATGQSAYNNVLWTMMTEFIGSFLVFGFLLLFGQSRHRRILYPILILLTMSGWLLGFVLGMILADLVANRVLINKRRNIVFIAGLLLAAIFFGGYPFSTTQGTIYEFITVPNLVGTVNFVSLYTIVGATAVVSLVLMSTQITKIFARNPISGLGRYTFSLYLVHIPIIFTFSTYIFINLIKHFGYTASVGMTFLLSIPVIVASVCIFERYIDSPSIRLSSLFAAMYLGERDLSFIWRARRRLHRITRVYLNKLRLRPRATEILSEEDAE